MATKSNKASKSKVAQAVESQSYMDEIIGAANKCSTQRVLCASIAGFATHIGVAFITADIVAGFLGLAGLSGLIYLLGFIIAIVAGFIAGRHVANWVSMAIIKKSDVVAYQRVKQFFATRQGATS